MRGKGQGSVRGLCPLFTPSQLLLIFSFGADAPEPTPTPEPEPEPVAVQLSAEEEPACAYERCDSAPEPEQFFDIAQNFGPVVNLDDPTCTGHESIETAYDAVYMAYLQYIGRAPTGEETGYWLTQGPDLGAIVWSISQHGDPAAESGPYKLVEVIEIHRAHGLDVTPTDLDRWMCHHEDLGSSQLAARIQYEAEMAEGDAFAADQLRLIAEREATDALRP